MKNFSIKNLFLQNLDYNVETVASYDVYCEGISNLIKKVDAIIVRIEQLKNMSVDSKSKFDEFKIKYNEGKISHKKFVEREKKHIAVSEFVRLAAKTELQKHITVLQFKKASIIDRDEYDRYVVEVLAVGQNLFGALLTKNFYVLVYDVSEKGYSSSALMSYVDAWSGELRTLKAINNWGNPQK